MFLLQTIIFRNAYHGMSPYTMGLTAHSTWKFAVPTGMGIHHVMNPDVYRGLWGHQGCRDCPVIPEVRYPLRRANQSKFMIKVFINDSLSNFIFLSFLTNLSSDF